MKYLIAFVALACTLCVHSSPLDRLESDTSIDEIKGEIYKILEDLDIAIPDGIQFPPRVKHDLGLENLQIFLVQNNFRLKM